MTRNRKKKIDVIVKINKELDGFQKDNKRIFENLFVTRIDRDVLAKRRRR